MALTTGQLTRLRAMVGEAHKPAAERYFSDADLQAVADDVGLVKDDAGVAPAGDGYTATYDLYRVAAEVWRLKAGIAAESFDFIAEGGDFKRSQVYANYLKQAARYAGMAQSLTVNTGA